MGKMVIHKSIQRPTGFGGTVNTTLCGRMNSAFYDGMNSGDGDEVTCKFCLRELRRLADPRNAIVARHSLG
jgi:hypothetical protein